MLLLNTPVATPFGLDVSGTVWRWLGLQIDAGGGQIVVAMGAYPSVAIAAAAGTPAAKPPLVEERYSITGADFAAVVLSAPVGPTLSDVVSHAIYAHIKSTVAKFADAADVDLPTP